ncbi:Uncharacterised protein [Edwardsiella ictaluri]|nr:Uncharacterised protein [Edwardsiella ictaluri]
MRMKIVGPDLWASPSVPSQCCRKALRLVSQYHRGDRNYTRLEDRGCGYVKINIGPFWRLRSRNGGRTWMAQNHTPSACGPFPETLREEAENIRKRI